MAPRLPSIVASLVVAVATAGFAHAAEPPGEKTAERPGPKGLWSKFPLTSTGRAEPPALRRDAGAPPPPAPGVVRPKPNAPARARPRPRQRVAPVAAPLAARAIRLSPPVAAPSSSSGPLRLLPFVALGLFGLGLLLLLAAAGARPVRALQRLRAPATGPPSPPRTAPGDAVPADASLPTPGPAAPVASLAQERARRLTPASPRAEERRSGPAWARPELVQPAEPPRPMPLPPAFPPPPVAPAATAHLLLIPSPERYVFLEREGPPPDAGTEVRPEGADGARFVVSKVTASPLGDGRPCAYLQLQGRSEPD